MSSPGYSSARLRPRRAGLRFIRYAQLKNRLIQLRSPFRIRHNFSFTPGSRANSESKAPIAELERELGRQQMEIRFLERALRQVEERRQPKNDDGAEASSKR
jgi:hypothetical protein